ncbi:MAG TPA: aspartyl protease family protein [Rhizomicrobium sp.]|nr:aspartyl protease family protein [Rhizomicrobium sp.]
MTLAAPAHAADCAPARLAAIRIGTLPDGRIVVPVTVETQALYFLLDTGGVSTTMKWDLAKEMKLPVRQTEHTLVGVGGSTLNFALAGENFSVGSLRVENKPIYVETRPLLFADGTLASDILSGYDVEIDVPQGRLNLFAPGYCAPPEWGSATMAIDISRSGHVRFPVKIDGATIDAVLDTGSAISLIGMRAAAQLGVYPNSPGLRRTRDAGKYPIYTYPFQSMEIGGLAVKNPSIAIAADGLIPSNDLVLGMDMLSQMHLAIAYGSKRLYIANIQGK